MLRNRYVLLADLPLIAVAAFGAFALRFDWVFLQYRPEFVVFLLAALVLKPPVYFAFGMYSRYWRYSSTQDLVAIVLAVSAASVVMAVFVGVSRVTGHVQEFARPVLMIDWLLALALAGGLRMSVRIIGDAREARQKPAPSDMKNVLIVGAGDAGALVVRELRKNPQLGLHPVAFVDDAANKFNKHILGVPVRGPIASLEWVVKQNRVSEVIIAMPRVGGSVVRDAAAACRRAGVQAQVVPGVFELLDGQVSINRLRKVEIADLLRRPQLLGQAERLAYPAGQTVLITGAGGSIGSELARQLAFAKPGLILLLGHGETSVFETQVRLQELFPDIPRQAVIADIRDAERINRTFETYRPSVVFHAAAHKHVPLMEANPLEAVTNNILGTLNVVRASVTHSVERLVLISTDKAVSPSSVMGATKRIAEAIVREAATRHQRAFVVVRFGNVLGSRGSVVPLFRRQIERGGPITVTHPSMKRYFMTIPEAVHLVLRAGGMGTGGELYVLNMGEQVRIVDLVRDLVRLSGLDPDAIAIQFTGVRHGEKLEEALWDDGAVVDETAHQDILIVRESDVALARQLREALSALRSAQGLGTSSAVRRVLDRCDPDRLRTLLDQPDIVTLREELRWRPRTKRPPEPARL